MRTKSRTGRVLLSLGLAFIGLALLSPGASAFGGKGKGYLTAPGQAKKATPAVDTTASGGDVSTNSANSGGDYDDGTPGGPSGNGNGTANPCAGCSGDADHKNPPGQFKDGSDHNNGYECDGNNGVGRTNPAHTGCPTTTTTVPEGPTTTTTAASATTTTAVPATTTTVAPATTTTTAPEVLANTSTSAPEVLGVEFERGGPLASTGSSRVIPLFWVGLALTLLGAVLVAARRWTGGTPPA